MHHSASPAREAVAELQLLELEVLTSRKLLPATVAL